VYPGGHDEFDRSGPDVHTPGNQFVQQRSDMGGVSR